MLCETRPAHEVRGRRVQPECGGERENVTSRAFTRRRDVAISANNQITADIASYLKLCSNDISLSAKALLRCWPSFREWKAYKKASYRPGMGRNISVHSRGVCPDCDQISSCGHLYLPAPRPVPPAIAGF